jgi:hypothetical protein
MNGQMLLSLLVSWSPEASCWLLVGAPSLSGQFLPPVTCLLPTQAGSTIQPVYCQQKQGQHFNCLHDTVSHAFSDSVTL